MGGPAGGGIEGHHLRHPPREGKRGPPVPGADVEHATGLAEGGEERPDLRLFHPIERLSGVGRAVDPRQGLGRLPNHPLVAERGRGARLHGNVAPDPILDRHGAVRISLTSQR